MDQRAAITPVLVLPYNVEHEVHWAYRAHHATGEWFDLHASMMAALGALAARA